MSKYGHSTLTGALKSTNIESWIHDMLLNSDNPNTVLSDGIKADQRVFFGPVRVKLDDFQRVCGPESNMIYQVNEEYFNYRVNFMVEAIQNGWDVPPILIERQDTIFHMCDGNHRFEALKRAGEKEYYVIILGTTKQHLKDINSYLRNR